MNGQILFRRVFTDVYISSFDKSYKSHMSRKNLSWLTETNEVPISSYV